MFSVNLAFLYDNDQLNIHKYIKPSYKIALVFKHISPLMVDVIVYKRSPYGLVFIHDKSLGFIIYHTKHERVYVSYNILLCGVYIETINDTS